VVGAVGVLADLGSTGAAFASSLKYNEVTIEIVAAGALFVETISDYCDRGLSDKQGLAIHAWENQKRKRRGGGGMARASCNIRLLIGVTELLLPKLGPKKTAEPKKSLNCIDIDTLRLLPFCCPPCRANTRPCKLWLLLAQFARTCNFGGLAAVRANSRRRK
jgi:hypothetical protein